ncbi:unnamed protein product, partial [Symbiodinium pilosum]
EFRDHGVEMMGPAAELLQTSKKWSSNFQRDMMRKANRQLPVLLPHELVPWLVEQGVFPVDEESDAAHAEFWEHLQKVGTPTHNATANHVPLYIWGDDAEFTEHHQDKLVVISIGRVLE